jgi:hypothetical protein
VDAHPQPTVCPVLKQINVVVPAANRAELHTGEVQQRPLLPDRALGDNVEHGMVDDRFLVLPTHAERDRAPDFIHDPGELRFRLWHLDVRADCTVSARDVIADASRDDDRTRREYPADRHGIALVVVAAEHATRIRVACVNDG